MVELLVKKSEGGPDVLGLVKKAINQAVTILAEGLDKLYRYWRVVGPRIDEETRRNYIILLLAVLSFLFFGLWGIVPLLTNNINLQREFKYGRNYETALVRKIDALSEGKKTIPQIMDDLDALNKAIPDTPLQAELIEELSIDGGTSGFSILSISFTEKTTVGKIVSEKFECIFDGSEADLIDLLEAVGKGRLIQIKHIRYSRQIIEGQEKIALSLTGTSFYNKAD